VPATGAISRALAGNPVAPHDFKRPGLFRTQTAERKGAFSRRAQIENTRPGPVTFRRRF
jgi:hypothetical protein